MSLFVNVVTCLYISGFLLAIYSVITSSFLVYALCIFVLYVCMQILRKKTTGKIEVQGQAVYITGCDTGETFILLKPIYSCIYWHTYNCNHLCAKNGRYL